MAWADSPTPFSYFETPVIDSMEPQSGPANGGTLVKLRGSKFSPHFDQGHFFCRIGPAVGKAKVLNEHHMQCTVQDIPLARQNMTHNAAIALNNYSFTKPHSRTLFVAYGIRYIEPNAGPINAKTPIIIHGAGFFETKEAKCRFGVPGNYAIVKATVLSSEKMLCRAPGKFKFGKGFQLPVGVPFSIALN